MRAAGGAPTASQTKPSNSPVREHLSPRRGSPARLQPAAATPGQKSGAGQCAKHNGRGRAGCGEALSPEVPGATGELIGSDGGPRVSNPRHLSSLETDSFLGSVTNPTTRNKPPRSFPAKARGAGAPPDAEGTGQGRAEPRGRGNSPVLAGASGSPGDTQPRPGAPPSRTRPRATPGGLLPEPAPIPPWLPVSRQQRSPA